MTQFTPFLPENYALFFSVELLSRFPGKLMSLVSFLTHISIICGAGSCFQSLEGFWVLKRYLSEFDLRFQSPCARPVNQNISNSELQFEDGGRGEKF